MSKPSWVQGMAEPGWVDYVYKVTKGSPQDPIFHAEGPVDVHTAMVVEAMKQQPEYLAATLEGKDAFLRAATLHDLGKPWRTQYEGKHIRNHGHSEVSANLARGLLYGEGYNPVLREQVCQTIRHHGFPLHGMDATSQKLLSKLFLNRSQYDFTKLAALARADLHGRVSLTGSTELKDKLDLYESMGMKVHSAATLSGLQLLSLYKNKKLETFPGRTFTLHCGLDRKQHQTDRDSVVFGGKESVWIDVPTDADFVPATDSWDKMQEEMKTALKSGFDTHVCVAGMTTALRSFFIDVALSVRATPYIRYCEPTAHYVDANYDISTRSAALSNWTVPGPFEAAGMDGVFGSTGTAV